MRGTFRWMLSNHFVTGREVSNDKFNKRTVVLSEQTLLNTNSMMSTVAAPVAAGLQKAIEIVRQNQTEVCDIISEAASASLEPATLWKIKGPSVQEIYRWLFPSPLGPDVRSYIIQTSPCEVTQVDFPRYLGLARCQWLDMSSMIIYVNSEIKGEAQAFEFMDYVHGRYENYKVLIKRFNNCKLEVIDQEASIRGILNCFDITQTLVGVLPGSSRTFDAPALVLRCPPNAVPLSEYLSTHCQTTRTQVISLCRSAVHALYITHQHKIILNDLDISHMAVCGDVTPKVLIMDLSAASIAKGHRFHKVSKMAAPEVINGGRATAASDIYSLGVILEAVVAQCAAFELKYAVLWCCCAVPKERPSAEELLSYLYRLGERTN